MSPIASPRRLLPDWLATGNFLSCRLLEVAGAPSHVGCMFRQEIPSDCRAARWTIHHYPPPRDGRPSGAGVVGLTLAFAGTARFRDARGRLHDVQAGNLFQVRQVEEWKANPPVLPGESFAEFSVFFEPRLADSLGELGLLDREFIRADTQLSPALVGGYVDLLRAMEDHTVPGPAVLRQAVSLLEQAYSLAASVSRADELSQRACRLLAARPEPGYTAEQVAAELGVPYETFRRRFKRSVGVAPGEYQVQRRIAQAIRLLRTHSVQETSELLGYTDAAFFSRQFKAAVGLPPKHFRPRDGDEPPEPPEPGEVEAVRPGATAG